MPQKAEHTVHILEGKAVLYQRANSPHWHVRYKADGKWLRTTTKKENLADAKSAAVDLARFPDQTGHSVHGKLITRSTAN